MIKFHIIDVSIIELEDAAPSYITSTGLQDNDSRLQLKELQGLDSKNEFLGTLGSN